MRNCPRVSIVIPVFNGEKYLCRSIESVLKQTYPNIELIVVNDGSTDKTTEILGHYQKTIKIIEKQNTGVSDSRNIGIKHASGEYVMFLDVDDEITADAVSYCVETMRNVGVDIIRFNGQLRYNNKIRKMRPPLNEGVYAKDEFLNEILSGKIPSFACFLFARTDLVKKVFFPKNISYMEDYSFTIDLVSHSQKIYLSSRPLYVYYQESTSVSHSIDIKRRLTGISYSYQKTTAKLKLPIGKRAANYFIGIYLKTELYLDSNHSYWHKKILGNVQSILRENHLTYNNLSLQNKILFIVTKSIISLPGIINHGRATK